MFIPTWIFWILFAVLIIFVSDRVGRPRGDYDMVSPLPGLGVIVCGIIFMLAFFLGKYLG